MAGERQCFTGGAGAGRGGASRIARAAAIAAYTFRLGRTHHALAAAT
jgi:hypothetical protein